MKFKSLIIVGVLALVLTLSGCDKKSTNKLTCTRIDTDGKSTYEFSFDDNDNLESIKITMEFEEESYADIVYKIYKSDESAKATKDGKKVTRYEPVGSFKESLELIETTKEKVKAAVEASGDTCK